MTEPTTPAAPAAPSPLGALAASMSRAELAVLGGGALLLIVDLLSWFVGGFGYAHAIVAFAALATVLILARNSLPAAVSNLYQPLLFVSALVVTIMGARSVVLFLLEIMRPPAGASPEFLLNFLAVLAGTAAMAYGAFLMWKGRDA